MLMNKNTRKRLSYVMLPVMILYTVLPATAYGAEEYTRVASSVSSSQAGNDSSYDIEGAVAEANALNLKPVSLPQDDDDTAPTINFSSLWDGQTITLKSLSAIDVSVEVTDENLKSSSITVERITYDGNSISWTPSAFGTYGILAYAEDSSGNSSAKNITVVVVQDTIPQPHGSQF